MKKGKQAPVASWRGRRGCPDQRVLEGNQKRRVTPLPLELVLVRVFIWFPAKGWRGLPRWLRGKKSACQYRRQEFDPWVRKIC